MGKRDVERELVFAQAKLESLTEQLEAVKADKVKLQGQVEKLQDALVSARAPEAYRDMQIEKEEAKQIPMSEETMERNRINKEVTENYLKYMEESIFKTPEDIQDLLSAGIISDHKPPGSLHGNEES